MDSQYAVIGAGLMGSSTAWRLAQRGHEVTLVERERPASPDGSSHGSARIFRYVYPDLFYTELVKQAREAYAELEAVSGQQLFTATGSLDFGRARPVRVLAEVLAAADVEHDIVSAEQAREWFPQIKVDTDALWHPGAGVVDAESAVHAMVAAATSLGGELRCQWPVRRVERISGGFRLHSDDGSLTAEKVVVAAGGYVPRLVEQLPLPAEFASTLPTWQVSQENAFHFPYRQPGLDWPTFIHRDPEIRTYCLPGGRDAGFRGQKLAEFSGGRKMATAEQRDGVIDPVNRARLVEYVAKYLPGLEPEPYAEATCLFTSIASEDFLIDTVDGLTLVSACSGHGAKFGPLIGKIVADEVTSVSPAATQFRAKSIAAACHALADAV